MYCGVMMYMLFIRCYMVFNNPMLADCLLYVRIAWHSSGVGSLRPTNYLARLSEFVRCQTASHKDCLLTYL